MRLTLDMVEWSIEATPEELDPEGCFDDPRDVKMARKALHDGDVWGWCAVKVTGRWNGLEASDHLGACSYMDENDFKTPGGYYDDMRANVLKELDENAEKITVEYLRLAAKTGYLKEVLGNDNDNG